MPARKQPMRRRASRTRSPRRARSRAASRRPDALRLLKDDHARVKSMFEKFERASGRSAKEQLAEKICEELKLHARVEEEVFYPRVRESIEDQDLMNEAEIEHASAKDLIGQIQACSPSDPKYDALVTVLREYIQHHVKEEEGEMFKKARQSGLDLVALGEQMQQWKSENGQRRGPLAALLGA